MENWHSIMYDLLRSDVLKGISVLYMISWIFIGNFILLNLLLAVLLDSFQEEQEEEEKEIQQEEKDKEMLIKVENKKKQKLDESQKLVKKRRTTMRSKSLMETLQEQFQKNFEQLEFDKEEKFEEMDESDIKQFVLKHGIIDRSSHQRVFKGIDCEKSLYMFRKKTGFRQLIYRIAVNIHFERCVLLIIILSSVKLVVDTYIKDIKQESQQVQRLSNAFDAFFSSLFIVEAIIKTIAYGFIMDKNSYLRETWNVLDFFIVVTSMLDLASSSINLPAIKILRLLRTLRPLRFISHNTGMKTIVSALIQSIGHIVNVVIVVMIVWLMFAILGVSLFSGKFFHCSVDIYINKSEQLCQKAGGEWSVYHKNFDNVLQAMMTLFIVSSFDNWPSVMYQAIDSSKENYGPILNNTPITAYFFVGFILVGSFFFMNFFIGVLFLNFRVAEQGYKGDLGEDDVNWIDMQKMIVAAEPDFECIDVPQGKIRFNIHKVVTSSAFDILIMICIVLNMIQMAMSNETATPNFLAALDDINYVFTVIFIVEAILKLIAFGKRYYISNWNKFDFFVVCCSLLDFLLNFFGSVIKSKFLRIGPQLARVLRVLRVSRLLRLIGKSKGLQALIQTIMFSLPSLMNVFSLLMIVLFIYSILGVQLFGDVLVGENIIDSEYRNFENFGNAMIMLFRMSTGEDWSTFMIDLMQQKNQFYTRIYFVSFVLICSNIMINLFILVILQQFNKYYLPAENVISLFKDNLEYFKKTWQEFSVKYGGQRIKDSQLIQFFKTMNEPLGLYDASNSEISKEIIKMGIRSNERWIYFHELLYRAMKRVYGSQEYKSEQMKIKEFYTLFKIHIINLRKAGKASFFEKKEKLLLGMGHFHSQCNPFLQKFFLGLSFRAWRRLLSQKSVRYSKFMTKQEIKEENDYYTYINDFIEKYRQQTDQDNQDDIEDQEEEYEIVYESCSEESSQEETQEIIEDINPIKRESLVANTSILIDRIENSAIQELQQEKQEQQKQKMKINPLIQGTLEEVSEEQSVDLYSLQSVSKKNIKSRFQSSLAGFGQFLGAVNKTKPVKSNSSNLSKIYDEMKKENFKNSDISKYSSSQLNEILQNYDDQNDRPRSEMVGQNQQRDKITVSSNRKPSYLADSSSDFHENSPAITNKESKKS